MARKDLGSFLFFPFIWPLAVLCLSDLVVGRVLVVLYLTLIGFLLLQSSHIVLLHG